MIHDPPFTIASCTALPDYRIALAFADGCSFTVDLSDWIARTRVLHPLRDAALFATARSDARGGYVVWIEDDLELAADNLRNLATEQAGGIGHERMVEWMHRNGLTQERAAEAIGISRRMLNYYLSAEKPIPQTVWLACVGWEALHKKRHPGKRSPVASSTAVLPV